MYYSWALLPFEMLTYCFSSDEDLFSSQYSFNCYSRRYDGKKKITLYSEDMKLMPWPLNKYMNQSL